MTDLYFAYGSNLTFSRLRSRAPSARFVARARHSRGRLSFDKDGRDGSGKANFAPSGGDGVWGVVYSIASEHWEGLDAHEPGYNRVPVTLRTEDGEEITAQTYVAQVLTDDPVPFDWYKQLLVDGAREHRLPAAWVKLLVNVPDKPDDRRPQS